MAILLALILMITLSGCETAPTDITDLLLPPKLTGDQLAIEKALEANIGTKYLLKYPLTGKYRTAFILHDIDGDGVDEALALYSLDNETAGTHIMVLKEVSGKWQKQCDISGDGNEVNRIEFGDYDGSGRQYLTVGWTLFNSTDLGLSVYSIQNKTLKNLYKDSFTDMAVLDMDGNGTDDILLLKLDTGSKPSLAQARLISYDEGRLKQISSAPLDSTVSSYAGVYTTKLANGKSGVYIDGYKGAHSMATELVIWKNGGLATPFFNAKSGTASSTFRDVPIDCTDIDGDSQIEIPMPVELPGYESTAYANKLWLVRWCIYNAAGKITPKLSTIINLTQGYYFQI
ncbi:MAG: hypothetical protein P4L75_02825, partial [Clostridia bacterium]|nr:hypothetical protein [Clostridia bacterium]